MPLKSPRVRFDGRRDAVRSSGDVVEIQLWLGQLELHEDGICVAIPNQIDSRVQE